MKWTIMGFNQQRLVDLKLDALDVIIIRWIVDFYNTGKMKKHEFNGKQYVWIYYQTVVEELPVLNIEKRALAQRLDKMVDCGLLEKYVDKKAGNYTYFRFIEETYLSLISQKTQTKISTTKGNGIHIEAKEAIPGESKGIHRNNKGYVSKTTNIYSSISDSSTSIKEKDGGLKSTVLFTDTKDLKAKDLKKPFVKEKSLKEKENSVEKEKSPARELVQFFYKTLRPEIPSSVIMQEKEVKSMKSLLKKLDKRRIKAYIEAIKSCKGFHCLNCNSPTYLYSNLQSIYEELYKRESKQ